jgi:hypothetical protein
MQEDSSIHEPGAEPITTALEELEKAAQESRDASVALQRRLVIVRQKLIAAHTAAREQAQGRSH